MRLKRKLGRSQQWLIGAAFVATLAAARQVRADVRVSDPPALERTTTPVPHAIRSRALELGASASTPIAKRAAPDSTSEPDQRDEQYRPLTTGTRRLSDRFYEVGFFAGVGGPLQMGGIAGSGIGMTGVQVLENHGYLSKFTIAALVAMAHGQIGGGANSKEDMDTALKGNYLMEVRVYTDGLWGLNPGAARGQGFESYLGGEVIVADGRLPWVLDVAGTAAYITAASVPFNAGVGPSDGKPQDPAYLGGVHYHALDYVNFGLMLRLHAPINEYFELLAQWDLNLLQIYGTDVATRRDQRTLFTSPLRIGAVANLTDRIYVRGIACFNSIGTDGLGYEGDFGVRF
ncbi:MAG: hypothetical protein ACHREM_01340 [Polyangiales bacterium]